MASVPVWLPITVERYGVIGTREVNGVDTSTMEAGAPVPAQAVMDCVCDAQGIAASSSADASPDSLHLYHWLEINDYPSAVSGELQAAGHAKYVYPGNRVVIHVVNPDLRGLTLNQAEEVKPHLVDVYQEVFRHWLTVKKQCPQLRLLPLSSGSKAGSLDVELPRLCAEAIQIAFANFDAKEKKIIYEAASNFEFCVYKDYEYEAYYGAFEGVRVQYGGKQPKGVPLPKKGALFGPDGWPLGGGTIVKNGQVYKNPNPNSALHVTGGHEGWYRAHCLLGEQEALAQQHIRALAFQVKDLHRQGRCDECRWTNDPRVFPLPPDLLRGSLQAHGVIPFPPDDSSFFIGCVYDSEKSPCTPGMIPNLATDPMSSDDGGSAWARLSDWCSTQAPPQLFDGVGDHITNYGRVIQGALDTGYIVEALNAISLRPKLARSMFYVWDTELSIYIAKIYKNGCWMRVELDDYVPVRSMGAKFASSSRLGSDFPICCRSEHFPDVLWPSLVEKAYAKINTLRVLDDYFLGQRVLVKNFRDQDFMSAVVKSSKPVMATIEDPDCPGSPAPGEEAQNWDVVRAHPEDMDLGGGWEAIGGGGRVEEALADLTGGVAGRFRTEDTTAEKLFVYIYELQRDTLFVCRPHAMNCEAAGVKLNPYFPNIVNRACMHDGRNYIQVFSAAPGLYDGGLTDTAVPWSLQNHEDYPERSKDGFFWCDANDFHMYFDQIFECRLVNSPDVSIKGMPPPRLPAQLTPPVHPGMLPANQQHSLPGGHLGHQVSNPAYGPHPPHIDSSLVAGSPHLPPFAHNDMRGAMGTHGPNMNTMVPLINGQPVGHPTMAQGHVGTMVQGHMGTMAQGHMGTMGPMGTMGTMGPSMGAMGNMGGTMAPMGTMHTPMGMHAPMGTMNAPMGMGMGTMHSPMGSMHAAMGQAQMGTMFGGALQPMGGHMGAMQIMGAPSPLQPGFASGMQSMQGMQGGRVPIGPGQQSAGARHKHAGSGEHNMFWEYCFANRKEVTMENPPEMMVTCCGDTEVAVSIQQVDGRLMSKSAADIKKPPVAILLKVYESVDGMGGNLGFYSNQLVCKSEWLPVRDSMVAFKSVRGGKYLVVAEFPGTNAVCDRLIFRCYTSRPDSNASVGTGWAGHNIVEPMDYPGAVKWSIVGSVPIQRLKNRFGPEPYDANTDCLRKPEHDEAACVIS